MKLSTGPSVSAATSIPSVGNLDSSSVADPQISLDSTQAPNVRERADSFHLVSRDDDVSDFITNVSETPICTSGRFGDLYTGIHKEKGKIALKRLRVGDTDEEKDALRRFEREADTWRPLRHIYILEFLGTYKWGDQVCLVSLFIENGSLLKYLENYPNVNRVRLLYELSEAVDYLHREQMVHGDIKGRNILVSEYGHVLLCDFGLTKLASAQTSLPLKGAGSIRWQSPELWEEGSTKTFASDIYAFSMTIVEVLTGRPPFPQSREEGAVVRAVLFGNKRPEQAPMESNGVSYMTAWEVAEACWPTAPEERMPMSTACLRLKEELRS